MGNAQSNKDGKDIQSKKEGKVNNRDITSKTTKMHTTRFIIAVYNTCFVNITLSLIKLVVLFYFCNTSAVVFRKIN